MICCVLTDWLINASGVSFETFSNYCKNDFLLGALTEFSLILGHVQLIFSHRFSGFPGAEIHNQTKNNKNVKEKTTTSPVFADWLCAGAILHWLSKLVSSEISMRWKLKAFSGLFLAFLLPSHVLGFWNSPINCVFSALCGHWSLCFIGLVVSILIEFP